MCDEATLKQWAREAISRREFGVLGGAAALVACSAGGETNASESDAGDRPALTETMVEFETEDGTMDAVFIHPAEGAHPGVIFWPDIASIRETKRNMARRLAGEGYSVLVLNPYYRDVAGEQFVDFAEFFNSGGFEKVGPWREKHTAEGAAKDAAAAWLDGQAAVDTARGLGVQGYCMGGPLTVWSAAAVPDRIKAAVSLHGGGLVREDDPQSPHRLLDQANAAFLIAVARDDDAKAPEDKTIFAKAAEDAGVKARVHVYNADHGWTVPDIRTYDAPAAEEVYADLLALYADNL